MKTLARKFERPVRRWQSRLQTEAQRKRYYSIVNFCFYIYSNNWILSLQKVWKKKADDGVKETLSDKVDAAVKIALDTNV